MRLLVITQKVDKNDSNLGFFHAWLEKLAAQVEHLYVICLEKGEYALPNNVTVLSLGKEAGASRLKYVWRFYKYIWRLRKSYDGVFVHMNPEYAILGGSFWRLWHKKVLLWYTHKAVNLKLRLAEKFVTNIFTVSKESFRLPSKKVEVVGHGINVDDFFIEKEELPKFDQELKILAVGRITPSKDFETVIRAIREVKKFDAINKISFDIFGDTITKKDIDYRNKLLDLANGSLGYSRVGNRAMPGVYQAHNLLIHTSRTGSVDKVVLEALAAGLPVVTSSKAYADAVKEGIVYTFPEGNYQELAKTIEKIYKDGILKNIPNERAIEYVRTHHNLDALIGKIIAYF